MIKLWTKYKHIIAYLFWGVITTILNIAIFMGCVHIGINYQIGNLLGWIVAVLVAYITNKIWVFYSPYLGWKETIREMGSFFFYRLVTLVMDVIITYVGISLLKWDTLIVKIIDNIIVIMFNYIFSKLIIFKGKQNGTF